jgi:hypothetical protein
MFSNSALEPWVKINGGSGERSWCTAGSAVESASPPSKSAAFDAVLGGFVDSGGVLGDEGRTTLGENKRGSEKGDDAEVRR